MLRKLNSSEIPVEDLLNIYVLFIRSRLEQSAVVWHASITQGEEIELERVQKVALRLILREDYESYANALSVTNLETLKARREYLCLKFAKKCIKSEHICDLSPLNYDPHNEKYKVTFAYMQRLLNSET